MNILDIDAINFAGRVAHVAAAELAGLLATGEIRPDACWFSVADQVAERLEAQTIDDMALYAATRLCSGETLYRRFRGADWGLEAPATRMAFDLFAATVAGVSSKLLVAQKDAERRAAAPPPAPALRLEDSIFEPFGSLGELRPEAVESSRHFAPIAMPPGETITVVQVDGPGAPAPGAPLTIGEAPPSPPVFRGGRGRRKPD